MKDTYTLFKMKVTVYHTRGYQFTSVTEPMHSVKLLKELASARDTVSKMLADGGCLSVVEDGVPSGENSNIVMIPHERVDYVRFEVITAEEEEV